MGSNKENSVDEGLKKIFIEETRDQLERMVQTLLVLEKNPHQLGEEIHELFRVAHNIKGSSGMMGLIELKETMHKAEDLFDAVRNEHIKLNPEKIDLLLELSDDVLAFITEGNWNNPWDGSRWNHLLDGQNPESQPGTFIQETSLTLTEEEKTVIANWQIAGNSVYGIDLKFNPDAMMRSASSLAFLRVLEKWGTIFKTAPDRSLLSLEQFVTLKVVLQTSQQLDSEAELNIKNYPIYDVEKISLRRWEHHPDESADTQSQLIRFETDNTIRVDSVKINKLINNIGDLLTIKTGLVRIVHERNQDAAVWNQLSKIAQQLEQLTNVFQQEILDLRMVPVNQLFSRFHKIVRDVAKKKGIQVELNIVGGEAEIDKQISERLVDPLTHLVRNAVDHGIDSKEARQALGKPVIGKIVLSALHRGDNIIISVSDDGKGLDFEKIRKKAIEKELIAKTDNLSDEEVIQLIFNPGFSTADQVSDISGRGVGLDVVKTSLNHLKGDIEVKTVHNKGTAMYLKVPLTMAIIQCFMVRVDSQIYGIPAAEVVESTAIDWDNVKDIGGNIAFNLREDIIPLLQMGTYLSGKSYSLSSPKNIPILIVKKRGYKLGLIVDELVGQEEIMIKQINKSLPENPLIAGASLLGNGEIGLIIDVVRIINEYLK